MTTPPFPLHALAATAVVLGGFAIAAPAATEKAITASGVGGVKIGASYTRLHDRGLIRRIRHGCELGGPNTRSAKLLAPLKGQVNFTLKAPRKVTDVTVNGGATARGVGIGDKIADIKAAYPKAKVDHSTDKTFLLTIVRIPKNGGVKLEFGVSTKSKRATLIGVPHIAVCD